MTIHEVKSGDCLWNLAKTYNTTANAIQAANPGIDPKRLKIGQNINIPDEPNAGLDTFKKTTSTPAALSGHTIKSGETFWSLAKAYKTTTEAIEKANPGVDPSKLKIGQKINIPGTSSSKKSSPTQVYTKAQIKEKIKAAAKEYGIDENLALAVVEQESVFNPNAKSHTGAVGLFQLTGIAAEQVKGKKTYDVDKNIEYGTKYLKWCIDHTRTNEEALVAYNRGLGAMKKAKANNIPIDSITDKKNGKGYAENVLAIYDRYKNS